MCVNNEDREHNKFQFNSSVDDKILTLWKDIRTMYYF